MPQIHYLHKHMLLIRKVFRMGTPFVIWKKILDRFHNACYDTKSIVQEEILQNSDKDEFQKDKKLQVILHLTDFDDVAGNHR